MKIRSVVPENGCLIFFGGRKKTKKNICKTYTLPPHRRLRKKLNRCTAVIFSCSDNWRIDMQCAFPGATATHCCSCFTCILHRLYERTVVSLMQTTDESMFCFLSDYVWNKQNMTQHLDEYITNFIDFNSAQWPSICILENTSTTIWRCEWEWDSHRNGNENNIPMWMEWKWEWFLWDWEFQKNIQLKKFPLLSDFKHRWIR